MSPWTLGGGDMVMWEGVAVASGRDDAENVLLEAPKDDVDVADRTHQQSDLDSHCAGVTRCSSGRGR